MLGNGAAVLAAARSSLPHTDLAHTNMNPTVNLLLRTALLAGCGLGSALAQQQAPAFALFGRGCPAGSTGAGGPVALHNNGLPALGFPMQIDMTQGPPNGFAVLMLAATRVPPIDLAPWGAAGCFLYLLPDISISLPTSATGTAAVTFTVPNNLGLAGSNVFAQWVAVGLPTLQISTSNAGVATLAPVQPALTTPTISAPPSGPVGTVITIRTRNLGTTNPDDVCVRLMDPSTGGMNLLRVTGITFDTNTGEDVIATQLATVATRGGPVQAQIGMMRGGGTSPTANASTCLNTPVSAWAWQGAGLPGNNTGTPTSFTPTPSANRVTVSFVYDAGTNSLYADVPIYPFGNGGIYPTGAGITTDAHGDILCGGVPSAHFDHFVETVTVKPACALTNQQLVVEHAPQLQAAFDNAFGPGRLTITAETAGPLARIRIKPTNAGCTLTGGGGSVVLTQ